MPSYVNIRTKVLLGAVKSFQSSVIEGSMNKALVYAELVGQYANCVRLESEREGRKPLGERDPFVYKI